jgi:anti-sigma-K factor RskA
MSCRERRERIYLHAAGVLEDDERSELEAHLATGCPECHEALDAEREQLGALALALAPVAPPARVRERLLERVRDGQRGIHPIPRPAPRAWRPGPALGRAAGFAAAALGAAALTLVLLRWPGGAPATEPASEAPREDAASELAVLQEQLAEQDAELAGLEERLDAADDVAKLLGARELEVLDLAAAEPDSAAWGRAFWDPEYRCYFRAEGLAPLAEDRHYVLWMVGAEERVHAAGTLEPDGKGHVTFYTRLPRELSPISRTFVTVESEPTGEAPNGPTLLAGAARLEHGS